MPFAIVNLAVDMSPLNVSRWLRAIALDNIEAQRAQITEVVRQRGKYDSALVMADKAKENKLPLSHRFATLWSNMLVDVTSPEKMIFDGEILRLSVSFF